LWDEVAAELEAPYSGAPAPSPGTGETAIDSEFADSTGAGAVVSTEESNDYSWQRDYVNGEGGYWPEAAAPEGGHDDADGGGDDADGEPWDETEGWAPEEPSAGGRGSSDSMGDDAARLIGAAAAVGGEVEPGAPTGTPEGAHDTASADGAQASEASAPNSSSEKIWYMKFLRKMTTRKAGHVNHRSSVARVSNEITSGQTVKTVQRTQVVFHWRSCFHQP